MTTHLRELGFGKTSMESMVQRELSEVLQLLQEKDNDENISNIIAPAVINILWTLTTGCRIGREDTTLKEMLDLLDVRAKLFDMSGGSLTQYPWLRFIAPEKSGYNLIKELNRQLKNLLMRTINEHYQSWYENRKDDLIHAFITEMKKFDSNYTFTGMSIC